MQLESGKAYRLLLKKGDPTPRGKVMPDGEFEFPNGDYSESEKEGVVKLFKHVERVYDEEGIAIGKTEEDKWEISTGDPQYPAIGFLLENVVKAEALKSN